MCSTCCVSMTCTLRTESCKPLVNSIANLASIMAMSGVPLLEGVRLRCSVMPGHACDHCNEMAHAVALVFVQAAAAHEAALGGGHVTTWIAVRGHVVDQQIVATLREPVPEESCQKPSQHAGAQNIQQQVQCGCDD